jgi:hypothetical protein
MRTTASFAATPRLPNWQSDLNPANKWFRSLFWERTVFSLLAKVEGLPPNLQGEIATRVGKRPLRGSEKRLLKRRNQRLIRYGPLRLLAKRGVCRG